MSTPLSPEPLKGRAVDALPPYVSNGLVGMRCPGLPHLRGTTMVGGFAGIDPSDGVELQIGVSSPKTGAVTDGWVEAVADGQTVGIAKVVVGAARLVATFAPPRGRPATLTVRYVPVASGHVDVRCRLCRSRDFSPRQR